MKILIIEDSDLDQILISKRLQDAATHPLIIHTMKYIEEAEELLKLEKYDLILLDKGLPDCASDERIFQFIKAHADQKIVILTGDDRSESIYECLKAGALDFWVKSNVLRKEEIRRILFYAEGSCKNQSSE